MFSFEPSKGAFFTEADNMSSKRVIVLGPKVASQLFGSINPIGNMIKVSDQYFTVVGVHKSKGEQWDTQVTIPFETGKSALGMDQIVTIAIKTKPNVDMDIAQKEIQLALLKDLKKDNFSVLSQKDLQSSINQILVILSFGLSAVAAISLVVGGIGIMNIMLVAVSERTREIGLRKAVGATPANIAWQFLIESAMLGLTGGTIGLVLGVACSLLARQFLRTETPLWAVFLAIGFSLAVGIIFGTYPAIKASRKEPIEALRYE
jgi:ABC-type antimicrobial peptide transport system permease subunit